MVQLFVAAKNSQFLVGRGGLEPPTNGLKGRCSTIELPSSKGARMLAHEDLPRKPNSNRQLTRAILQLGLGHETLEVFNTLLIHRMRA